MIPAGWHPEPGLFRGDCPRCGRSLVLAKGASVRSPERWYWCLSWGCEDTLIVKIPAKERTMLVGPGATR